MLLFALKDPVWQLSCSVKSFWLRAEKDKKKNPGFLFELWKLTWSYKSQIINAYFRNVCTSKKYLMAQSFIQILVLISVSVYVCVSMWVCNQLRKLLVRTVCIGRVDV